MRKIFIANLVILSNGGATLSFIAILLFTLVISTSLNAQLKKVDEIVAVVGNVAISSRELMTTAKQVKANMARQKQEIPSLEMLLPNVLEQLIVVKLQLQEAERLGIRVDEVMLDKALIRIAENNGQTLAEMKAQIEQQQMDYSKIRESVRQELIISQLRQYVIDDIEVLDSEIETALRELNAKTLFRFSYLSAKLPEDEGGRDKLKQQFQDLRQEMLYQNDFSKLAKKVSQEAAIVYKKSSPQRFASLPALLQEKVLDMNIGDITSVIKTTDQLYLFTLVDRQAKQLPSVNEKQYHIRHILLRPDAIHSDSQIRKKLLVIKKRIENGASFERLAKQYSQDPGSSYKGGDLGWMGTQGLAKEFAQQVEKAPQRIVIGPFATNFGQHLLEVLGERKQDISSKIQRQNIIAQLRREKSGDAINEWLLRLRESKHIDIKL